MKLLNTAAFFFFLLFSATGFASERNQVIETVARIAPSVGALYAQEGGGDMKFLCSATAVEWPGKPEGKTVILTANHCLQKGVSYLINFGDNRLRAVIAWKVPHYEVDAQKYPRRYNEPETDMALFLLDGTDVPTVPIAKESGLPAGASVVMVGYPLGVAKITYEGIVAGRFDRLGADLHGYILLQIFGAPGSSGSSVVNTISGEVVGILVAARQKAFGLPVIFATPVEYKEHLIPILPEK